MSVPFTKPELELIAKNAEAGNMLGPGETQALVAEVRRLELASLGMFDPVKVGQVVAQLQIERDQARDELQSIQRTRHDAYAQCLAAMVLLKRAVAVRIDDDWLKEAKALLNAFKVAE